MRKSLVYKLFLLTTALCVGLLLLVAIGQTFFFSRFYIANKVELLEAQLSDYTAAPGSALAFYEKNNAWIAFLDSNGTISNTDGYGITIQPDEQGASLDIPLYAMEGEYGVGESLLLQIGEAVLVDAVQIDTQWLPYQVMSRHDSLALVNMRLAEKLNGIHADPAYAALQTRSFSGTIVALDLPGTDHEVPFPFLERAFIEQVKVFQVMLLAPGQKPIMQQNRYTVMADSIEYQILVEPTTQNGQDGYLFAMTSLQPVGEAVTALAQFYPAFLGAALLLVLAAALIYSRWIVKPLISVNRVAKKITELDFTETLPVHSGDELGQLSANINRLSGELESHIGRLQEELNREKQLEETRKKFISGVSHELKTPLAVMKSCLSIIEDGITPDKGAHYFSAMQSKVVEMDALVMDMLDLAKMESGTYRPELLPFALDDTLRHVCEAFQSQILEKKLGLSLSLPPVTVIGHAQLISRVVSNFLSNAIRHTSPGQHIAISIACGTSSAMVCVENMGDPLSDEEIVHIWEQFYRAHPERGEGTGLGLAICKGILELHHADYGVENTLSGVRFFFTLSTP